MEYTLNLQNSLSAILDLLTDICAEQQILKERYIYELSKGDPSREEIISKDFEAQIDEARLHLKKCLFVKYGDLPKDIS